MALGSTQPLTEMNTRSISWGQRRPVCKNDNLPPSCAVVTKSGNLNSLETSGPVQACNGTALPFFNMKHLDDITLGRIHQRNAEHNEDKLKHFQVHSLLTIFLPSQSYTLANLITVLIPCKHKNRVLLQLAYQ